MRIKVFKAADLKEAMAMVKDELGSDAVILHTKRYKQGGFLGYKSKEVVEVTAAIDDVPEPPKVKLPPQRKKPAPQSNAAVPMPPRRVLAQYKTAGTEEGVSMARSAELAQRMQAAPIETTGYTPQPARESRAALSPKPERQTASINMPINDTPMGQRQIAERETGRTRQSAQRPQQPDQQRYMESAPRQGTRQAPSKNSNKTSYIAELQADIQIPQRPRRKAVRRVHNERPVPEDERTRKQIGVGQTDYGQQPVSEQKYDERAINKSHIIKAKRSNELDAQKSIEENEEKLTQKVTQVISQQASIDEPAREDKNEKIQALEDELAQMRMMLRKVMDQPHSDDETVTLQDALKSQAFSDQLMQDVIRKIPPASLLMPKDSEDALKSLTDYLHGAIKAGNGIGLKDGRPKIIALIGTTGVGKTTTIAKIAARFVLEKGVSVGLITADTYRISAVEQLKTYSDILGLPLEIVYSSAELKPALRKHKGKQLILIDTAGRSQNNEYQMSELKEFLEVEPSIEKHLVMSATTKERDAEKILERFSVVKPDRLIFTKVDETDTLGFIVNLLFDRRIALSYLTNGQSVPDDIEPARPDALAKLLLR